jgi:drug/metabolite transporter (DMT)-like permease
MKYSISTLGAGILWGLISLFLKPLSLAGFDMLQITALRGIFSFLLLFVFLIIKNPSLLKVELRDLWIFFGTGVLSLSFFSICYFKTILNAGAGIAVILLYTSPIFILFLARLIFKEKINLRKIIALILTFIGCFLVSGIIGSGKGVSIKIFLIGLCSGFGYALYSIFSRFALKKYNSITITFYTLLFSGLSLMPFLRFSSQTINLIGGNLLYILGISVLCTILPYILYSYGLSGLETGKAAILVTIEPLVGTLIGFLIFKEEFNFIKLFGMLLIFISVIILEKKTDNKSVI